MISLFLLLLCVHLIADFYLQRHSWIMDKVAHHERSIGLFKHMLTHVLLTGGALLSVYILLKQTHDIVLLWPWFIAWAVIITTHYLIDIWKTYQSFVLKYYLIDQLSHIVILLLISLWLSSMVPDVTASLSGYQLYLLWLCSFILLANPMAVTIMVLLMPYRQAIQDADSDLPDQVSQPSKEGQRMGIIERILVLACIGNQAYMIPVLLLMGKLYYRLQQPDAKDSALYRRYVLIGSSVSFISALLLGLLLNIA